MTITILMYLRVWKDYMIIFSVLFDAFKHDLIHRKPQKTNDLNNYSQLQEHQHQQLTIKFLYSRTLAANTRYLPLHIYCSLTDL